jgi:hypothetical protein
MADFDELIASADEAIANIIRMQELLKLVDENYDSPKRVELLVELYQGWIGTEIENLQWSTKRLKKALEDTRRAYKASQTKNMG